MPRSAEHRLEFLSRRFLFILGTWFLAAGMLAAQDSSPPAPAQAAAPSAPASPTPPASSGASQAPAATDAPPTSDANKSSDANTAEVTTHDTAPTFKVRVNEVLVHVVVREILEMKLLDPTLAQLDHSGLTVKSSFDIKPGTYLVRMVVRDGEGSQMAARNGAVTIPY
jgi:hypothetical protein